MSGRYSYNYRSHDTRGAGDTHALSAVAGWTYSLPDALGSVRQETDAAGAVTATREWTPFGIDHDSDRFLIWIPMMMRQCTSKTYHHTSDE